MMGWQVIPSQCDVERDEEAPAAAVHRPLPCCGARRVAVASALLLSVAACWALMRRAPTSMVRATPEDSIFEEVDVIVHSALAVLEASVGETTEVKLVRPLNTTTSTTPAPLVSPASIDFSGAARWSLFCWLFTMPSGGEPELVRMELKHNVSLFRCDAWALYSIERFELDNGVYTTAVNASKSKVAKWGSWMNTANFIAAWQEILENGRYAQYAWTVKVDADSVFFPDRLQWHLQKVFGDDWEYDRAYVLNCNRVFGFVGPLEIVSSKAVAYYGEHEDECLKETKERDFGGEDGYYQKCWERLNTSSRKDYELIIDSFCGWGQCAGNTWTVTFHAFKKLEPWKACWSQATGLPI